MPDVQSQLGRYQGPTVAISEAELERMAARAWHNFGIVLLRPEDLPNPLDRQALINVAERRYGRRLMTPEST